MEKIKCNECIYFKHIANTSETKQGICTYALSYEPTGLDDDCHYIPDDYKCGDCSHYAYGDDVCMSRVSSDSAYNEDGTLCPGFVDKYNDIIEAALRDWNLRGLDIKQQLDKVYNNFINNYKEIKRKDA